MCINPTNCEGSIWLITQIVGVRHNGFIKLHFLGLLCCQSINQYPWRSHAFASKIPPPKQKPLKKSSTFCTFYQKVKEKVFDPTSTIWITSRTTYVRWLAIFVIQWTIFESIKCILLTMSERVVRGRGGRQVTLNKEF